MNAPVCTPSRWNRLVASLFTGLLSVALADAANPSPPTPSQGAQPIILTSFLPVHSLTVAIAGDRARVENWLPQGVDPHDFQFSPRDLRRLRSASFLVVGGLGLEGWTEAKLRTLSGNPDLRVIEAAAGIPKGLLIQEPCNHDHDHGAHSHTDAPNPHFWLDPLLMAHAATNILRALQEAVPNDEATLAANAARVATMLHALHQDYARDLAAASTPFITYHNAFPYLARRYALRLAGVVESGPTDQPSARQLSDLGRLVRAENARVLFMDGEPPRLARQLAKDFRLKLASLETLETGEFGPNAYEDGMRRNLAVLKAALQPTGKP